MRKPSLCRPWQEGEHVACDGPKDCECSWCMQSRQLAQLAKEESELLWPLDDLKDPAY